MFCCEAPREMSCGLATFIHQLEGEKITKDFSYVGELISEGR